MTLFAAYWIHSLVIHIPLEQQSEIIKTLIQKQEAILIGFSIGSLVLWVGYYFLLKKAFSVFIKELNLSFKTLEDMIEKISQGEYEHQPCELAFKEFSDITEKQAYLSKFLAETTQELTEASERQANATEFQQALIDAIPNPIFFKNDKGDYCGCNKAFSEMFLGESKRKVAGINLFESTEMLPPQIMSMLYESSMDNQENQEPSFFEKSFACVDEVRRDFIVYCTNFSYQNLGYGGSIGVMLDVSRQKQVEKELRIATREAELANQSKSVFLATMSHEIRTPMNAIVGMTDLMMNDNLSQGQRESLEMVKISADHLLNVINDILDFSKIEAGRLELEQRNFDLLELLNSTTRLMRYSAENRGIELLVDCSSEIFQYVEGDSIRIRQILINLVSNAIKFTEQGHVKISVFDCSSKSEDIVGYRFLVSDTGVGISKERLTKIFDRFGQAEASTTRKYGGTGLGLAICKNLVEMMDGEISVQSEEGKGSTFEFSIFLKKGTVIEKVESNDSEKEQVILPGKVLVVDDNPMNIKQLEIFLDRLEQDVDSAADGQQAIEKMQAATYDFVFMDVEMPVMDGFEATRRIRKGEAGEYGKTVPIIALTAHAMSGFKSKCLKNGMTDFLTKPVLWADVRSILGVYSGEPDQDDSGTAETRETAKALNMDLALEKYMGGDLEIYKKFCGIFLENLDERVERFKETVLELDFEGVRGAVHAFKPSALMIGAVEAHRLSEALGDAAKAANANDVRDGWEKLNQEIESVRGEILNSDYVDAP
jgi:signal transduction histidine kinase/CheY-like chemotaxis protein/HPt (histidine-containing phosphotransfer) domain-containing protein